MGDENDFHETAHQHTAVFSDPHTGQWVKLCPNTNPGCFCHRQSQSLCQGPFSRGVGGGQQTRIDCPYLFVAAGANVANSNLAGCVLLFNASQGTERAVKLSETFLGTCWHPFDLNRGPPPVSAKVGRGLHES